MIGNPPHDYGQHVSWLSNVINNQDRVILIVEIDDVAIGMITFYDFNPKDKSVEFGWYIGDLNYVGKGFGKKIMQIILSINQKLIRAKILKCVVDRNNVVALSIYKNCGFSLLHNDSKFDYFEYKLGE